MNVVEHRPPLKRIDFGIKPRVIEPEGAAGALARLALLLEHDRIWRLIERTARGCNPGREM